jgi:hypothetical protein
MSKPPKSESPGGAGLTQEEKINQVQEDFELTLVLVQSDAPNLGWRGALASGNGRFRINGAYDTFATGRRARRLQARLDKANRKRGAQ